MKPRIAVIGLVGHSQFFGVPCFHQGGETITATSFYHEWGGKGFNQAIAAARQGAAVNFIGAVNSNDVRPLRDFCRAEGVHALLCPRREPTAIAAILTDGTGETRVTVHHGAELAAADVELFAAAIAHSDYLLLNNEVPVAVNLAAIRLARKSGTRIIYNPAPARKLSASIIRNVDLFTPNEFELEQLAASAPTAKVVTTLGARGCRIEATGEVIRAPKVKAVDSTGAGDTFNAVLAVRLAEGEPLATACRAAVVAASQSVTRQFVIPSLPYRDRT